MFAWIGICDVGQPRRALIQSQSPAASVNRRAATRIALAIFTLAAGGWADPTTQSTLPSNLTSPPAAAVSQPSTTASANPSSDIATTPAASEPSTIPTTTPAISHPAATSTSPATTPSPVHPMAASRPATGPAATRAIAPDQSTPRGAIILLDTAIASGDAAAIIKVIQVDSPAQAAVVRAYADNRAAAITLRDALWAKFPPSDSDRAKIAQRLADILAGVADWDEYIDGDDATVGPKNPAAPRIKLHRDNGQWKVLFTATFSTGTNDLQQYADALNLESKVYAQLTANVAAGKYTTIDEVEKDSPKVMQSLLAAATQQSTTAPTVQPATAPASAKEPTTMPVTSAPAPATVPSTEPALPSTTPQSFPPTTAPVTQPTVQPAAPEI